MEMANLTQVRKLRELNLIRSRLAQIAKNRGHSGKSIGGKRGSDAFIDTNQSVRCRYGHDGGEAVFLLRAQSSLMTTERHGIEVRARHLPSGGNEIRTRPHE